MEAFSEWVHICSRWPPGVNSTQTQAFLGAEHMARVVTLPAQACSSQTGLPAFSSHGIRPLFWSPCIRRFYNCAELWCSQVLSGVAKTVFHFAVQNRATWSVAESLVVSGAGAGLLPPMCHWHWISKLCKQKAGQTWVGSIWSSGGVGAELPTGYNIKRLLS